MDENELISGECQKLYQVKGCHVVMKPWRWLDIGGGGPVRPEQPGTKFYDEAWIAGFLGLQRLRDAGNGREGA